MALFIRQEVDRTELQKRIAKDLADKAKKEPGTDKAPDLVEDSEYIKGYKGTTSLAWAWILILVAFIFIVIWLISTGLAR